MPERTLKNSFHWTNSEMAYSVFLTPKCARQLRGLERTIQERVKDELKSLKDNPQKRGERLVGNRYNRVRVGDLRAIYEIDEIKNKVIILFIGHRSKVYDDFRKISP